MTDMIKQRTDCDCGVAATAMYLGCSYEEAVKTLTRATGGLWTVKLPVNFSTELLALRYAGHPSAIVAEIDSDKPAIMSVLSINLPGKLHSVYWDGADIFDPSTLLTIDRDLAFKSCVSFTQRLSDLVPIILRATRFARVRNWHAEA